VKNTLTPTRQNPEVDPSFEDQARAQRGGLPHGSTVHCFYAAGASAVPIDPWWSACGNCRASAARTKPTPSRGDNSQTRKKENKCLTSTSS